MGEDGKQGRKQEANAVTEVMSSLVCLRGGRMMVGMNMSMLVFCN